MKITELLTKDTIQLNLKAHSKEAVIDELIDVLDKAGKLNDKKAFKQGILKREEESTTGIGEGIAIPHAKTAAVKTPAIVFGKSENGVDYESLDGQPAYLFFMIAATEGANQTHLEALSRLSGMLMHPEVRDGLMQAKSADEVLSLIESFDREDEEEQQKTASSSASKGKVLAVTACPTGIAHTYMAADALKLKAKEMGIDIKVETNGSGGAKNVLTPEEIAEAPAIIVAADTKVDMDRFDGKPVIEVPVADGIRRPEELIEKAIKKDAPIYHAKNRKNDGPDSGKNSSKGWAGFYKHLMNGVSNMLPFVVGGGILIAISFMFGIHSADPKSPEYNKFAEIINTIGGQNAFMLIVPVLAGFIAMSIADRPGFAPGMVGGLMAYNGHAGFLGGLIAGFLAGYIVVGIKYVFRNLPQVFDGLKPVLISALGGLLDGADYVLFSGTVKRRQHRIAALAERIGNRQLNYSGTYPGAMMAIDMGGPINKAAYTFGLAMIEAGNFYPHAAIMAGGMVPPLGLALATTFFRNKFTDQERKAGFTCYFMGISFITEGAIPFAASDPLRVIPATAIGSAVAGALTMAFHIGLPAPHGGIFVFPVVQGNVFLYILAILIGSIVTALIVGFLKKPVKSQTK